MEKENFIGTKEIELLEFKAGENSYGVNINDIREILPYSYKPTPVPNSHPFIEGMIMPRDFIIPIVNFSASILLDKKVTTNSNTNDDDSDFILDKNEEMIIVTSINNLNIAFHVDGVSGIHKIDTSLIEKPGKKLTTKQKNVISGIYKNEKAKIEIVDLRQIINIINPNMNVN